MLCSGPELGRARVELYPLRRRRGHSLIFHEDVSPGHGCDARSSAWTISVADFEILANRPDCLCAWGIARETSAALGTKLTLPEVTVKDVGGDIADHVQVTVEDFTRCPRYCRPRDQKRAASRPSPMWLRRGACMPPACVPSITL